MHALETAALVAWAGGLASVVVGMGMLARSWESGLVLMVLGAVLVVASCALAAGMVLRG